ncbi:MAG: CinA family protein [Clostridia bacterium]
MNKIEEVEKIVKKLQKRKETISFMESCTGGLLANEITNISGASEILKVSLVTYSNAYKEYFGVNPEVIKKYTVYSVETAMEMAKQIANIANSDWGIGVTGQLGRIDPVNPGRKNNEAFYTIYQVNKNHCYTDKICINGERKRQEQKKEVAKAIFEKLLHIIEE